MITEITYETYNNISDFNEYSFFSGNGVMILENYAKRHFSILPDKVIK